MNYIFENFNFLVLILFTISIVSCAEESNVPTMIVQQDIKQLKNRSIQNIGKQSSGVSSEEELFSNSFIKKEGQVIVIKSVEEQGFHDASQIELDTPKDTYSYPLSKF